jgi:hypothetical protein
MGSPFCLEWQPAAVVGEGRVPNFINLYRGYSTSSGLILDDLGNPRLFAYPGSRRLDAGLVMRWGVEPNAYGLRPVVAGFDITLDPNKPLCVQYYQQAFGPVPIYDIRIK